MKILRYEENEFIKPAILDKYGNIRNASSIVHDWDCTTITTEKLRSLSSINIVELPLVDKEVVIAPFICKKSVGKFIGVGLNYSDHALEAKMEIPKEPIIFMKATSSICGPNDNIQIPKKSFKTDWEVELGIIIGKEAKYISENQSQEHIAGYCVVNDISERSFQLEHYGQWVKGKSCDTFGPIGPYLVTKDEISDPQNLKIWLEVNDKRMQNGSTSTMIYGVNFIVSYISQFMSLQPGDIITTGTPPGVGMGSTPPVYLKSGDTMRLGIEGLGEQVQKTIMA